MKKDFTILRYFEEELGAKVAIKRLWKSFELKQACKGKEQTERAS